jgi:hypothetical protein
LSERFRRLQTETRGAGRSGSSARPRAHTDDDGFAFLQPVQDLRLLTVAESGANYLLDRFPVLQNPDPLSSTVCGTPRILYLALL